MSGVHANDTESCMGFNSSPTADYRRIDEPRFNYGHGLSPHSHEGSSMPAELDCILRKIGTGYKWNNRTQLYLKTLPQ